MLKPEPTIAAYRKFAVTTDLSRLENMFVISRNTAFTYRNQPIGTKQIGRELGVRYVLEGSVRRSGRQVRINARLINTETDAHLWAERFDGDTEDLFMLQDEVTRRIAFALDVQLINAEATRKIDDPDALDCILRGRAAEAKPPTRDTYAEAIAGSSEHWRLIQDLPRRRASWQMCWWVGCSIK